MAAAIAVSTALAWAAGTSESDQPRTMRYACASAQFGTADVLHYLSTGSRCSGRGATLIDFTKDAPVIVCRKEPGAARSGSRARRTRGPAGLVRLVDDRSGCRPPSLPNETVRSLPRSGNTYFCGARGRNELRWVSRASDCGRSEFAVRLPKRVPGAPAGRAKVVDDNAATDEDSAVGLDVLSNDASNSARRTLRITSLDTAGTRGAVTLTDGRLSYHPEGRFDELRPGQTETERFRYRASDGVHATEGSVAVSVSGVNDAPSAAARSGATDEDTPVTIDALGAGNGDPENDAPLSLGAADTLSALGARVVTRPDGTLEYDPRGTLDRVAGGESVIDTFGYSVRDPGGAESRRATVTVTVGGANDDPHLGAIEPDRLQAGAGPEPSADTPRVSSTLTVADPDGRLSGATVRIVDGLDTAHHDTLSFDPRDGITGTYDAAQGKLTLTGAASPADYQAALRSVVFTTDSTAPTSGPSSPPLDRTIRFQVDDGAVKSNTVERSASVTAPQATVTSSPALVPSFSPEITDYAVRCDGNTAVDVQAGGPAGTTVSIDGQAPAPSTPVDVDPGQGFRFRVTRSGSSGTYHVRCLPTNFPQYAATVDGDPQAQWYLVDPFPGAGQSRWVAIFNNQGVPMWWAQNGTSPVDFKLLSNGNVGWFSHDPFNVVKWDEYTLGGAHVSTAETVGTPTDPHDYQELPNGNRFLMSYKRRDHVDVSAYTGKPEDTDASVLDAEVQEIAPDGSLVWSWNSASHIGLAETGRWWTDFPPSQTESGKNLYDIIHINSMEADGDGIVMSMRHTDSLYRVDKATGDIDWKLGGSTTPDSLTIVGDDANAATDFGGQHDARILPDGSLTLHDNGTGYRPSRALRFTIDEGANTATLVESVSDPLVPGSFCCGSARKLPTGNWVMSWGGHALVTELTPSGDRQFKLTFSNGQFSYRADPVMPGRLSASALRSGMDAQYPR